MRRDAGTRTPPPCSQSTRANPYATSRKSTGEPGTDVHRCTRPGLSHPVCRLPWTAPGSNRMPPACKAGALPGELAAQVCPLAAAIDGQGTLNLVRLTASHLAFPTVEFSRCKRIPPAGCRFAGTSGVEPDPRWFWRPDGCPWPRPIASSVAAIRNRPPGPVPGGGVGLRPSCRLHVRHRSTCGVQR